MLKFDPKFIQLLVIANEYAGQNTGQSFGTTVYRYVPMKRNNQTDSADGSLDSTKGNLQFGNRLVGRQ